MAFHQIDGDLVQLFAYESEHVLVASSLIISYESAMICELCDVVGHSLWLVNTMVSLTFLELNDTSNHAA